MLKPNDPLSKVLKDTDMDVFHDDTDRTQIVDGEVTNPIEHAEVKDSGTPFGRPYARGLVQVGDEVVLPNGEVGVVETQEYLGYSRWPILWVKTDSGLYVVPARTVLPKESATGIVFRTIRSASVGDLLCRKYAERGWVIHPDESRASVTEQFGHIRVVLYHRRSSKQKTVLAKQFADPLETIRDALRHPVPVYINGEDEPVSPVIALSWWTGLFGEE